MKLFQQQLCQVLSVMTTPFVAMVAVPWDHNQPITAWGIRLNNHHSYGNAQSGI